MQRPIADRVGPDAAHARPGTARLPERTPSHAGGEGARQGGSNVAPCRCFAPSPACGGKAGMGAGGAIGAGFPRPARPPPRPSPAGGGGSKAGRFEYRVVPLFCSFPRLRGKAGIGAGGGDRIRCLATCEAPTPALPRRRGREKSRAVRMSRRAALLLLPPPAGEGRDGGRRWRRQHQAVARTAPECGAPAVASPTTVRSPSARNRHLGHWHRRHDFGHTRDLSCTGPAACPSPRRCSSPLPPISC